MHWIFALVAAVATLALSSPSTAEDVRMPRPAGIEPNVAFWTRIYSEVDGSSGLLHDSEHLDVVYSVVRFPKGANERTRDRTVEAQRGKIKAALHVLAAGRRSGLTAEQARILSLWPKGVTNSTLHRASSRIRFQLGQADKFRAGIERQGEWRDHIEKILDEHDVPASLVALPHVESSFNARAYSSVGAAGLWQFTRSTGRRYLRVDSVVDERLDPLKASSAAARLLRDNYARLDSWPLAITAYNHGASGMARAKRNLGTDDIATIVRNYKSRTFGFASRNFYSEFLAAEQIDRNPERYFGPVTRNRPRPTDRFEVPHYYSATSLASAFGVDLDMLRDHNPALRTSVWNGSKFVPRGYELRLPAGSVSEPAGQIFASIPASERKTEQHRDRLYKVRRGDSISGIASRYGVRESDLVSLNNLRSRHTIRVGQVLALPDTARSASPAVVARQSPPADGEYRVARGDNLTGIARRYGVSVSDIVAWSGLSNRNRISVGETLRLKPPEAPIMVARAPEAATTTASASARAAEPAVASAEQLSNTITPVVVAAAIPATAAPATAAPAAAAPAAAAPEVEPITRERAIALIAAATPSESGAPVVPDPVDVEELVDPQPLAQPVEPTPIRHAPSTAQLVAALDFEVAEQDAAFDSDMESDEIASDEIAAHAEVAAVADLEGDDLALQASPADAFARPTPDPSQYAVRADGRIVVQADETLGHYADWLEIRTSRLRSLNRMRRGSTVVIGRTTKLEFTNVDPATFERRRLEYHHTLQEEFFGAYTVTGTANYELTRGDTLWEIAHERYKLPVWLLRQYNPDLDFAALTPGARMIIPSVEPRQG